MGFARMGDTTYYLDEGSNVTGELQSLARRAFAGGLVELPAGKFVVSEMVDWGSAIVRGQGIATQFYVQADVIGFKVNGSFGGLEDMQFEGRVGGENTGGVGVFVESGHKPSLRNVKAEGFKFAGFAFSGPQNFMVDGCFAQYNLYNFFLCNRTRNGQFLNCNASDWPTPWNQWMRDNAPNCRAIRIGQVDNAYIPQVSNSYIDWPSRINFRGGIFERFGRNDHTIEITHSYDDVLFDAVELGASLKAKVRVTDPSVGIVTIRDLIARSEGYVLENPDAKVVTIDRYLLGGGAPGIEELPA